MNHHSVVASTGLTRLSIMNDHWEQSSTSQLTGDTSFDSLSSTIIKRRLLILVDHIQLPFVPAQIIFCFISWICPLLTSSVHLIIVDQSPLKWDQLSLLCDSIIIFCAADNDMIHYQWLSIDMMNYHQFMMSKYGFIHHWLSLNIIGHYWLSWTIIHFFIVNGTMILAISETTNHEYYHSSHQNHGVPLCTNGDASLSTRYRYIVSHGHNRQESKLCTSWRAWEWPYHNWKVVVVEAHHHYGIHLFDGWYVAIRCCSHVNTGAHRVQSTLVAYDRDPSISRRFGRDIANTPFLQVCPIVVNTKFDGWQEIRLFWVVTGRFHLDGPVREHVWYGSLL